MKCRTLLLLMPLLLSGCINQSASYIIDGNEHALTIRVDQDYFWQDEITVKLIAAHLPDCQRQFVLASLPESQLEIGLFSAGDNVYTLRAGGQLWRVETQTCTQLTEPAANEIGERLGTFKLDPDKKMVFTPAAPSATAAAAGESGVTAAGEGGAAQALTAAPAPAVNTAPATTP
jgi:hypothetical protein